MSVTTTGASDDTVAPDSAFDRAIWHNACVCNNCLRRVKDVEAATLGMGNHDVEAHTRTPNATLDQDERIVEYVDGATGSERRGEAGESIRRPGPKRVAVPRTTCTNCGHIGCWAEDKDRSRIDATRLCKRIFPWLRELGVEHDRKTIAKYVWRAKGDPDEQGSDVEIFRDAVAAGVKAERPTTSR